MHFILSHLCINFVWHVVENNEINYIKYYVLSNAPFNNRPKIEGKIDIYLNE